MIRSGQMENDFTWIPTYKAIAERLQQWEGRQTELIAFLEKLRADGLTITPMNDKDEKGARFLLREIDPFTFMGVFNRGIRKDQRLAILDAVLRFFELKMELPTDFSGVPLLNNQKSWLVAYQPDRGKDDISRLWAVFKLALQENPLQDKQFLKAFDTALEVRNTNINLTMGLFWIRPDVFLNLDAVNRKYLKIKLPSAGIDSAFFLKTIETVRKRGIPMYEISKAAWEAANGESEEDDTNQNPDVDYWLVGAYWDGADPQDQTPRFLEEGIWENGYEDRYLDEVREMKVGDKIAIKASATQKHDLPFDGRGNTLSKNIIKAAGTIIKNHGDGTTVEVEWDPQYKQKDWFFYTNRRTVWHVPLDGKFAEYSRRLIDFVFHNKPQDYAWFTDAWWGSAKPKEPQDIQELKSKSAYGVSDLIESGVFLTEQEIEQTLDRLRTKKNLILQGPPE